MLLTGTKDLLLTPFYILIIIIVALLINSKIHKNRPYLKKIFMWGIVMRIIGGIAFALVSTFFYGGDTYNYFINGSRHIWDAFLDDAPLGLKIIFIDPEQAYLHSDVYNYTGRMLLWNGSATIIKLSAFIGLFTFHTYTISSIIFSLIAFSGIWAFYITIINRYPSIYKTLGYSLVFFPSLVFWGSGVMKDPITLGALGWCFYTWDKALIQRKKILLMVPLFLFFSWVILLYKSYIFICFLPMGIIYFIIHFNENIKSTKTRQMLKPILITLGLIISFVALTIYSQYDQVYGIDRISERSALTYSYIKGSGGSQGGSTYDIGTQDGSMASMIRILPAAINVALFRPYIWEVKNPFMLISSLESMFILYITILAIYRVGITNLITQINNNSLLLFLILFCLVFAFGTGASTGNFGTLVRYKIPLIPFYLSAIHIINLNYYRKKYILGS